MADNVGGLYSEEVSAFIVFFDFVHRQPHKEGCRCFCLVVCVRLCAKWHAKQPRHGRKKHQKCSLTARKTAHFAHDVKIFAFVTYCHYAIYITRIKIL